MHSQGGWPLNRTRILFPFGDEVESTTDMKNSGKSWQEIEALYVLRVLSKFS